jgi:hypothetical protein
MDSIPLIREQMYQVSPDSFFRVAGILQDGNVSGRFSSPTRIPRARRSPAWWWTRLFLAMDKAKCGGAASRPPCRCLTCFLTAPGCGGGAIGLCIFISNMVNNTIAIVLCAALHCSTLYPRLSLWCCNILCICLVEATHVATVDMLLVLVLLHVVMLPLSLPYCIRSIDTNTRY